MQVAAVYACVRVISEAVASLPLNVYRYEEHATKLVPSHHLHYLLHSAPNDEMTSFDLRETLMSHLLIYGNVMDLYHSLKVPYRNRAVFVCNDLTIKVLRKLKDANGQYLWQCHTSNALQQTSRKSHEQHQRFVCQWTFAPYYPGL